MNWGTLLPAALLLQQLPLSKLDLGAGDPAYTVYAAAKERSAYWLDQGYRLVYDNPSEPLKWTTDSAGEVSLVWKQRRQLVSAVGGYKQAPRIKRSYADAASLTYSPLEDLEVIHDFCVFTWGMLVHNLEIANRADDDREITLFVVFSHDQGVTNVDLRGQKDALFFSHKEPLGSVTTGNKPKRYPDALENVLMLNREVDSWGAYQGGPNLFLNDARRGGLNNNQAKKPLKQPTLVALATSLSIKARQSRSIRILRGVGAGRALLWTQGTRVLLDLPFEEIFEQSVSRYQAVPHLDLPDSALEPLYWQSFSLLSQSMMPPQGQLGFDYPLASREPTQGETHDGPSLQEALAMTAYTHMNCPEAMSAQRAFMQSQSPDGYIPRRIGPFVSREDPRKGQKTMALPIFNWINLEIHQVCGDREFLEDAYDTGSRFVDYITSGRDSDNDGLYEWSGSGSLESGRSEKNAVWSALGDKPESGGLVEALDLNVMLVSELKSLAGLADELGEAEDARQWRRRADDLADRINQTFWDDETGFYYHVGAKTNSFRTGKGVDLKRMEAVGFLPLWAGIAPDAQRAALLSRLKDPRKFEGRFGVPSLAADDPAYDGLACCGWNGPVHLLQNYLIFRGLLDSGETEAALNLAKRNFEGALAYLKREHLLPESFSPASSDAPATTSHIGAGILARMMIDLYRR